MSITVNKYRVWCTDAPAHWEYIWAIAAPTVAPSNGTPINSVLTSILASVGDSNTVIDNLPKTAFGELSVAEITPIMQLYFSYNNNPQYTKTYISGSGTVTNSNSMAVVSSGSSINSNATFHTIKPIKYKSGQGLNIKFTAVFTNGIIGNDQLIGGFDSSDGLGFGFNNTDFGIFKRKSTVTEWIKQTDWNIDTLDGNGNSGLNINFGNGYGNVFQIKYQYLGFGAITYSVENPNTGEFTNVHMIHYANANAEPSFEIPSFPLAIQSSNTTNTTNITISSGSMMACIEGKHVYSGVKKTDSWVNERVEKKTETMLNAYRVKTIFEGKMNKTIIYFEGFSFASGSNDKHHIIKIRKNPTINSGVWSDIDTGVSTMEKLTSGSWGTDGEIIFSRVVPGKGVPVNISIDISPISLFLTPGDTLVVTSEGIVTSGDSTGCINWLEDQ